LNSDVSQLQLSMKLDRLVVDRLFGPGTWLADPESATVLNTMLDELDLQEQVPGEVNTSRWTELGARLNMGLLTVFLGLHWEWEVPDILEQNQLMDKEESADVFDALEAGNDPEQVLRGLVQKAYFQYYRRSNGTH
jgi:hypothetical protein